MKGRRALFWICLIFIIAPMAAFGQTNAPVNQPAASPPAAAPTAQQPSASNPAPASGGTGTPPSVQPAGAVKQQEAALSTPAPTGETAPVASLPTPGIADASPHNFKLSPDGTVATILFDKESVEAMKTVISQLEQSGILGKVKGVIYSSAGITPMLVLIGEKNELAQKIEILRQFIPDQSQAHMVVISASLRELQDSDAYYVGLTLSPDITGVVIGGTGLSATFSSATDVESTVFSTNIVASYPYPGIPFSKIAQFQEAYNRGKVLVASEVYTRNGTKALLTNIESIPIFSVDKNDNVMTQYQNLETSIDVIPTTVDYNKEKPDESQVRIDALVKISVVTGTATISNNTQAPTYATKTFATTRVLKANNERYVVGTFVNDANYKMQTGLPLLSKIPLLKYLFSRENTEAKRTIAILTLAVKLVPMKVKDLTIQVDRVDPLEELYRKKGKKPGER